MEFGCHLDGKGNEVAFAARIVEFEIDYATATNAHKTMIEQKKVAGKARRGAFIGSKFLAMWVDGMEGNGIVFYQYIHDGAIA